MTTSDQPKGTANKHHTPPCPMSPTTTAEGCPHSVAAAVPVSKQSESTATSRTPHGSVTPNSILFKCFSHVAYYAMHPTIELYRLLTCSALLCDSRSFGHVCNLHRQWFLLMAHLADVLLLQVSPRNPRRLGPRSDLLRSLSASGISLRLTRHGDGHIHPA